MTVLAERAATVTCPDCGVRRQVSAATVGRIRAGLNGASELCFRCKRSDPEERLRRYWLRFAGVDEAAIVAAGGSFGWVGAHGLPDELWEMASSLDRLLMRAAA